MLDDLRNLTSKAETLQSREDPLYGVANSFLWALKQVLKTSSDATISILPQARIIDQQVYDEVRSLTAFLNVTPDFGLMLDLFTQDRKWQHSICLLFLEIKMLTLRVVPGNVANHPSWYSEIGLEAAKSIFYDNLPQFILQGFNALHSYPDQDVRIGVLVGIYLTVLQFRHPTPDEPPLEPLPRSDKEKKRKLHNRDDLRQTFDSDTIASLLPFELLQPIIYTSPIFDTIMTGPGQHEIQGFSHSMIHVFYEAYQQAQGHCQFQPHPLFPFDNHVPFEDSAAKLDVCTIAIAAWYQEHGVVVVGHEISPPTTPERQAQAALDNPETPAHVYAGSPWIPAKKRRNRN